jgi:hypothetical protein
MIKPDGKGGVIDDGIEEQVEEIQSHVNVIESTKEAQKLLNDILEDKVAATSYYATIFSRLLQFKKFSKFLEDNYVILHGVDHSSGMFFVDAQEVPDDSSSEVFRGEIIANARKKAASRAQQTASGEDGEGEGE